MKIRKANPGDLNTIIDLSKKALEVQKVFKGYVEWKENVPDILKKEIEPKLRDSKYAYFLAELDGKSVGLILCSFKDASLCKIEKLGEMKYLYVEEEYRSKGVASELVGRALAWYKTKGIYQIDANVYSDNISSKNFWEKQGLETVADIMTINIK